MVGDGRGSVQISESRRGEADRVGEGVEKVKRGGVGTGRAGVVIESLNKVPVGSSRRWTQEEEEQTNSRAKVCCRGREDRRALAPVDSAVVWLVRRTNARQDREQAVQVEHKGFCYKPARDSAAVGVRPLRSRSPSLLSPASSKLRAQDWLLLYPQPTRQEKVKASVVTHRLGPFSSGSPRLLHSSFSNILKTKRSAVSVASPTIKYQSHLPFPPRPHARSPPRSPSRSPRPRPSSPARRPPRSTYISGTEGPADIRDE